MVRCNKWMNVIWSSVDYATCSKWNYKFMIWMHPARRRQLEMKCSHQWGLTLPHKTCNCRIRHNDNVWICGRTTAHYQWSACVDMRCLQTASQPEVHVDWHWNNVTASSLRLPRWNTSDGLDILPCTYSAKQPISHQPEQPHTSLGRGMWAQCSIICFGIIPYTKTKEFHYDPLVHWSGRNKKEQIFE